MMHMARLFWFLFLLVLFSSVVVAADELVSDVQLLGGSEAVCGEIGSGWVEVSRFSDGDGIEQRYCALKKVFVEDDSYIKVADLESGGCSPNLDARGFFRDDEGNSVFLCVERGSTSAGDSVVTNVLIDETCDGMVQTTQPISVSEDISVFHCLQQVPAGGGEQPREGVMCTCASAFSESDKSYTCENGLEASCGENEVCFGFSEGDQNPCVRVDDCFDGDLLDYSTKSYAADGSGMFQEDACSLDGKSVLEAFCNSNVVAIDEYECVHGCSEGVCLDEPVVEECRLTNPRWRRLDNSEITPRQFVYGWYDQEGVGGDIVHLSMRMSDACEQNRYSFAIFEKDVGRINDDFVREVDIREDYQGRWMRARFKPPYLDDGFISFGENPEFYFVVLEDGRAMLESEVEGVDNWRELLLKVREPRCASSRPSACLSEGACFDAGGVWRNGECVDERFGCSSSNPEFCMSEGTCVFDTRVNGEIRNEWITGSDGVESCLPLDRCTDDYLDRCSEEECPSVGGAWNSERRVCEDSNACTFYEAEWLDFEGNGIYEEVEDGTEVLLSVRINEACYDDSIAFDLEIDSLLGDRTYDALQATINEEDNLAVARWEVVFDEDELDSDDARIVRYIFSAQLGDQIVESDRLRVIAELDEADDARNCEGFGGVVCLVGDVIFGLVDIINDFLGNFFR